MTRVGWRAIILLALATPACELVAGVEDRYLVSTGPDAESAALDADDGSSPSNRAPDAAGDARVADSTVDSPGDGDASDGGDATLLAEAGPNPDDTAPDAGTLDPSAPCSGQTQYLFCDDFNYDSVVGEGWTYALLKDDGGALDFYDAAYTSAPRSLQVQAPASTGDQLVVLGQVFSSPLTTRFRLAFDLRIDVDSLEPLPISTVAQVLAKRDGGQPLELDYQLLPSGVAHLHMFIATDGGVPTDIDLPAPPLRTWTRLVIAYDVTAGVTVLEDGATIGASPMVGGVPELTQFQVGMVYQTPPGTADLLLELDNVVFKGL
jgi:hypothetical protein